MVGDRNGQDRETPPFKAGSTSCSARPLDRLADGRPPMGQAVGFNPPGLWWGGLKPAAGRDMTAPASGFPPDWSPGFPGRGTAARPFLPMGNHWPSIP